MMNFMQVFLKHSQIMYNTYIQATSSLGTHAGKNPPVIVNLNIEEPMPYRYEYNKNFQVLEQYDVQSGRRVSCMSMPESDLSKLAFLAWYTEVDASNNFYEEQA